jgi:hypothetical protein
MSALNGQHESLGEEQGRTDEIKQAIPYFRKSPVFTVAEKAALKLADAMAGDHKKASYDEIFSGLKKYFTEEQIVARGWKTRMGLGHGRLTHAWMCRAWGILRNSAQARKRLDGLRGNVEWSDDQTLTSKIYASLLLALSRVNQLGFSYSIRNAHSHYMVHGLDSYTKDKLEGKGFPKAMPGVTQALKKK